MCQAQIKKMACFLSQAVQSSVLAEPKILADGQQPTEKCALELVLKCWFLKELRASHAQIAKWSLKRLLVSFQEPQYLSITGRIVS
jgi:hypothetical protein